MTQFMTLSPRKTKSQPKGNQGWNDRSQYQEEGVPQTEGAHHHVRDQGAVGAHGAAQQGGNKGDVMSTPPSPTSPTRTRTTPPGSPVTPRPSSASGARLTCTQLWKKKSLERRMSSSQGKKRSSAKRSSLSSILSQQRCPADTRASPQKVSPASASGTNTIKYQMYPTPENARPGQELPRKSMIIEQTLYAQKQLAETSDNPKDETKFLTNQMEGNFGMK